MIAKVLYKIVCNVDFDVKNQTIGYLNVYSYSILRKNQHLLKNIDSFTLDGIFLVLLLRALTNKKFIRLSPDFSSYFTDLFNHIDVNRKKVFFIGSSRSELKSFLKIIESHFPRIVLIGYSDGYYQDEDGLIKKIITQRPDVVFVSMGSPKQEIFLNNLKENGYNGQCFACGAFFSQTADGGINYYPKNFSVFHLRWLYRILKEPKLIKRYTIDYPIGFLHLLKDWFYDANRTK